MNWLIENKEWVFSGIGVFAISALIAFLLKKKEQKNMKQVIKSGKGSNNIQTSGDVTVNIGKSDEK